VVVAQYAKPPVTTTRVAHLAADITASAPTAYDKVRAIEHWLGTHTKYSLDAPLSRPGEDVVDHFVFDTRLGWCEQVASTLVAMLAGGLAFGIGFLLRRLRRDRAHQRPPSWAATMQRRLERVGRRAGVGVERGQTVRQYAGTVAVRVGDPTLATVGTAIDVDA